MFFLKIYFMLLGNLLSQFLVVKCFEKSRLFDNYHCYYYHYYYYFLRHHLRSIIGCPGGMSTFRLYCRALFGTFFLEVFLE